MTATQHLVEAIDFAVERRRRQREVVFGYRIFAALGWGDLGDGHVTARDPELIDHMWLLRYGVGFESATIDDLVLVRPDGHTLGDSPINETAHHIHHPIHAARPDVIGVAHTHTPWGTPFCATSYPLQPITQESCVFHNNWASFDDEEVQVLGVKTGERIAKALGQKQAILLRNHGLLTTGASVGETIAAFVILERAAEAHMKVPKAKPISRKAAEAARDDLIRVRSLESAFEFLVSRYVDDKLAVD